MEILTLIILILLFYFLPLFLCLCIAYKMSKKFNYYSKSRIKLFISLGFIPYINLIVVIQEIVEYLTEKNKNKNK